MSKFIIFYKLISASSRKSSAWTHSWARARMPGEQINAKNWKIRVRNHSQTDKSGDPKKGKSWAWKYTRTRTRSTRQQIMEENGSIRNRKEVINFFVLKGCMIF